MSVHWIVLNEAARSFLPHCGKPYVPGDSGTNNRAAATCKGCNPGAVKKRSKAGARTAARRRPCRPAR